MPLFPTKPIFQNDNVEELIEQLSQLPTYTIGRKVENAINIANPRISGHHARLIQCSDVSFILEDLDSKNGTFVNGQRITRKIVDKSDSIQLADATYTVAQLLEALSSKKDSSIEQVPKDSPSAALSSKEEKSLDYSSQFSQLQFVYEQYPKLRRDCRNREKMIRTGSVILSSIVGVSASVATGGAALPLLHIISGAGLGVLIPTLCSTLLSTEEKLEVIDKEYRERYRCPNPICRDPFGTREWELLAQQKTCHRCQAVWAN